MKKPITNYEKSVIDRIEEIRQRQKITMESMAELMGVGVDQYKRFTYRTARVPLECIYNLSNSYPADIDYIIYGKKRKGNYAFISALVSGDYAERAAVYAELSSYYAKREYIEDRENNLRRERAAEKAERRPDFITADGDLIEVHKDTD